MEMYPHDELKAVFNPLWFLTRSIMEQQLHCRCS
jgi:hypothetical protein